jgi:translation elongation factor EF-4
LDKPKAGKKMRQFGKMDISQEAIISALRVDEWADLGLREE